MTMADKDLDAAAGAAPCRCDQCSRSVALVYTDSPTARRLCVRCRFSKLFLRLTGG